MAKKRQVNMTQVAVHINKKMSAWYAAICFASFINHPATPGLPPEAQP